MHSPLTRGQWIALGRRAKILACAEGSGMSFGGYWGVAAIFPEARSMLQSDITASQTTINVTTTTNFPDGTTPFQLNIGRDAGVEGVTVTAVSGTTLTVTRGVAGTTAKTHSAGDSADVAGDLGGTVDGQELGVSINGGTYDLATIVLPHQIDVEGAAHEMGHGHGYGHSRAFSYSTDDYRDPTDIMSAYNSGTFSAHLGNANYAPDSGTDFGGTGLYKTVLGEETGSKAQGLDAINLDKQGWIPASRETTFGGGQITTTLHSLGERNSQDLWIGSFR